VPQDSNAIWKNAEKKFKYKNTSTELQKMWNMNCLVIPALTRPKENVGNGLKNSLEKIPGTQ